MIPPAARRELEEALGDGVRFDASMSRYTSLCVGGPADALARPASRHELARVLGICAAYRVPHQLIGSGFNTLVLDGGVEGVALQLGRLREIDERPGAALRAEAGVSHSQVTRFCSQRGFGGLEFAAGIPGTVGGWVAMNAGIPDREAKDAIREVEVMSPTGRTRRHLGRGALRFAYRGLRGLAPGSVVVSALFAITLSTPSEVRREVEQLLSRRANTQPLNVPSCGSVFKNPARNFAGRLIEEAGLKGHRIGNAQISPVHANFIANLGGATAGDVLALIEHARKAVEARSGVRLVPEVRVVGRPA
ncbi:MAG: UDP-N-acetylmuramate dehydrogenase [Myxococcota bacterium]|nr:UDP-N-acetylmuramate dehydrogenase [Myxococcota bacterium]